MRTNQGQDWQARVMGDANAAGAGTGDMRPADYIALSADENTPVATNSSLPGEITSGTLARAQATYAHTNGTSVYTLTKTFTSDLPGEVTVRKIGVFNAVDGGVMVFETMMNAPATLVSGDQMQVTETITL